MLEETRIPGRDKDGYIHPQGGYGHIRNNRSLFHLQRKPKMSHIRGHFGLVDLMS